MTSSPLPSSASIWAIAASATVSRPTRLKLARVLKASKVLERHLLDVVTNQWEWTFAVLNLVRLTILLSVYAHWQACFWGLAASYMDSTTWLTQFEADHYAEFSSKPEPLEKW